MASKSKRSKKIGALVFILFVGMFSFMIFAPASWKVSYRANQWSCAEATFLFDGEEPTLVLEVVSRGGYRAPAIHSVQVLSLEDKAVLGSRYQFHSLYVRGITTDRVWISDEDSHLLGLNRTTLEEEIDVTNALEAKPELKDIIEKVSVDGPDGTLRVEALDGHSYHYGPDSDELSKLPLLSPPGRPSLRSHDRHTFGGTIRLPQNAGEEILLEREVLYDVSSQRIIRQANLSTLITYRSLKGVTGKLRLARLSQSEELVWKLTEEELGLSSAEEGRRVVVSHLEQKTLYCVLEDSGDEGNVYVIAVEAESGKLLWSHTLF